MKSVLTSMIQLMYLFVLVSFVNSCSGPWDEAAPEVHTVEIMTMKFQPSQLNVNIGDTVIFINRDFVIHDVTEAESKRWNSMPLKTGKSYRRVVTGSVGYYCSFHPVMKGNITAE